MRAPIGDFDEAHPATDRSGLLPPPVAAALTPLLPPRRSPGQGLLIGSGRRRGKLTVPGKAFTALPDAVVVEGLGLPV
jgi:hypothetical protein